MCYEPSPFQHVNKNIMTQLILLEDLEECFYHDSIAYLAAKECEDDVTNLISCLH